MAKARGPFIDQSQSLNIHMQEPNFGKISSMHFHAWKAGLKTGMYYLRTRAAVNAVQFTVRNDEQKIDESKALEQLVCSIENPDDCVMCSG